MAISKKNSLSDSIPFCGVFANDESEISDERRELINRLNGETQNDAETTTVAMDDVVISSVRSTVVWSETQVESSDSKNRWYKRMPALLESEKESMLKKYPEFEMDILDDGRLCWVGNLSPLGNGGRSWTLMAVYDDDFGEIRAVSGTTSSVKVYSVDPDFDDMIPELARIPAVFSNLAQDSQGNHFIRPIDATDTSVVTAATALSWASKSLQIFEVAFNQNSGNNANTNETSENKKCRQKPNHVVFSNRAFTALLAETKEKLKTETGGIFLGVMNDDTWYVVEAIDPGPKSIFQVSYFEYDGDYVRHLANKVNRLYGDKLDVVGLWHRHPGSMDVFSHTDHGTMRLFAEQNNGVTISALANIDPDFRLTMYVASLSGNSVACEKITYEINDSKIPHGVTDVLRYGEIEESINGMKSGSRGIGRTADKSNYTRLITEHLKKFECCESSDDMVANTSEDERDSLIDCLVDECEFCDEKDIPYTCETNEKNQIEFIVGKEDASLKFLYSYVDFPIQNATPQKKRLWDCLKKSRPASEFEKKTGRQPCFVHGGKLYLYHGKLLKSIMEATKR